MIQLTNGKILESGAFVNPDNLDGAVAKISNKQLNLLANVKSNISASDSFFVTYFEDDKIIIFNVNTDFGKEMIKTHEWYRPISQMNELLREAKLALELVPAKVYGRDGWKIAAIGSAFVAVAEAKDVKSYSAFLDGYEAICKDDSWSHLNLNDEIYVTTRPNTFNGSNVVTVMQTVSQYYEEAPSEIRKETSESHNAYQYDLNTLESVKNLAGPHSMDVKSAELDFISETLQYPNELILDIDGKYYWVSPEEDIGFHLYEITHCSNHRVQVYHVDGSQNNYKLTGLKDRVVFEV